MPCGSVDEHGISKAMNIQTIVETVALSVGITVGVIIIYFTLRSTISGDIFRHCRCTHWSFCTRDTQPPTTGGQNFQPQDFIYRSGTNRPIDFSVVFIDRHDYQQLYLNSLRLERNKRTTVLPSAPPPPYEA